MANTTQDHSPTARLLHLPGAVAGSAVHLTAWTARTAVGAVTGLVSGAVSTLTSHADDPEEQRSTPPADLPSEPVNVVEELGLDPAPVEKPAPGEADSPDPLTSIDAAADPSHVDATPADVAKVLDHHEGEESSTD